MKTQYLLDTNIIVFLLRGKWAYVIALRGKIGLTYNTSLLSVIIYKKRDGMLLK